MGTSVKIGGWTFNALSVSVNEEATPLAAGDSSGGVGSFDIVLAQPDTGVILTQNTGAKAIRDFGHNVLNGKVVEVQSSRYGYTIGKVANSSRTSNGQIRVSAISRLSDLNVYNVQAQPFVGSLGDLFRYYCAFGGFDSSDVDVASSLESRPMVVPGWNGELWYHMKLLCAAEACEIALVDGKVALRQNRGEYMVKGQETDRGQDTPIPTLAQKVEVYRYDNVQIIDQLVYPPKGWTPEVEVLNVNAGEDAEYTLELSASVSSIQNPTMQTSVSQSYAASSVYTIVANDGLPVAPDLWAARGGKVEITIDPSTTKLNVKLHGAVNIPTASGTAATNFSLALGSDTTGNRYSTLRILGTGVAFDKTKKDFRTGITESQTGTEIGVTIDNPFLSSNTQLYRAGIRAAVEYSGARPSLTTTVVDPRTDTPAKFGNVNGARVWDKDTARWYRIRSANMGPALTGTQCDDDLTVGDVDEFYAGLTLGEMDALFAGLTLAERDLVGLRMI